MYAQRQNMLPETALQLSVPGRHPGKRPIVAPEKPRADVCIRTPTNFCCKLRTISGWTRKAESGIILSEAKLEILQNTLASGGFPPTGQVIARRAGGKRSRELGYL